MVQINVKKSPCVEIKTKYDYEEVNYNLVVIPKYFLMVDGVEVDREFFSRAEANKMAKIIKIKKLLKIAGQYLRLINSRQGV
jgi:hypothetical protein